MKRLIFLVIALVVLGAAWALYLENGDRQFKESLSEPVAPSKAVEPSKQDAVSETLEEKQTAESGREKPSDVAVSPGAVDRDGPEAETAITAEDIPASEVPEAETAEKGSEDATEAETATPEEPSLPPLTPEQLERNVRAMLEQQHGRSPDTIIPLSEFGHILKNIDGDMEGSAFIYFDDGEGGTGDPPEVLGILSDDVEIDTSEAEEDSEADDSED